ncbi:MAG: F0F1 ATP synthase subunit delta [Gammaproteobacteria bacterium]|nr:F0F1 ATP synthase subunit delta [Gammaproteobacteria bacterium]
MADNNTVARPYAQAAFEVAQESDSLAELSESFAAAKALMEDGQIAEFLGAPAMTDEERLTFLQGLFSQAVGEGSVFAGGSQHGTNFIKLLLENGRVVVLPEIADHFEALKAKVENTVDAVITSAAPLSKEQQQAMAASLKEKLGREINVTTEIDESLIGGAVIRAGDVVIDGSLRARLEGLANALTK